ncbi:MAG: hypothetical protein M1829_006051 [Trizodia sp. TS-e1964]|nr:MAG: hypothetical protein M1829_006051 [Trizodia sp. TS-e1964]
MSEKHALLVRLEEEFCPPLDTALFTAIASDYDLADSATLSNLRSTLALLKTAALAEESAEFDASGSGGAPVGDAELKESANVSDNSGLLQSLNGDPEFISTYSNHSSRSQTASSMSLGDGYSEDETPSANSTEMELLDDRTKEALLCEMFPAVKPLRIAHLLKKLQSNLARTMDDLLNISFMEDPEENGEMVASKGIDAFDESNHFGRARGKRRRKRQKKDMASQDILADLGTITPKYAPIDLSSIILSPGKPHDLAAGKHRLSLPAAVSMASKHNAARDSAFEQAAAAYRRGRSDLLMGAAAAYYSSLGKEHHSRAKKYDAVAADALVAEQSSKTHMDLHGVNVENAVRIARQQVASWWNGLGDEKYLGHMGQAQRYQIITGVGRHSQGGRARLGPAVGKMLVQEGWRVEVGEGVLTVTGVARKARATG